MRAIWHGRGIARGDRTIEVERNHDLPPGSLHDGHFAPNPEHTRRHCKGEAHDLAVVAGGETEAAAAWTCPEPGRAADPIGDRAASRGGVDVVE